MHSRFWFPLKKVCAFEVLLLRNLQQPSVFLELSIDHEGFACQHFSLSVSNSLFLSTTLTMSVPTNFLVGQVIERFFCHLSCAARCRYQVICQHCLVEKLDSLVLISCRVFQHLAKSRKHPGHVQNQNMIHPIHMHTVTVPLCSTQLIKNQRMARTCDFGSHCMMPWPTFYLTWSASVDWLLQSPYVLLSA